jgi:hypothetical protein
VPRDDSWDVFIFFYPERKEIFKNHVVLKKVSSTLKKCDI